MQFRIEVHYIDRHTLLYSKNYFPVARARNLSLILYTSLHGEPSGHRERSGQRKSKRFYSLEHIVPGQLNFCFSSKVITL
jgi:hypothetical protein